MSIAFALVAIGSTVACRGVIGPDPDARGGTRGPTTGAGGTGSTGGGATGAGTTGGGPQVCNPAQPTLTSARIWRLVQLQLKNSLLDVFGFAGKVVDTLPDEARLDGYSNQPDGLGISTLLTDYYFRAADEVALQVLENSAGFVTCPLASLDAACLGTFLTDYGSKAWRRPLTDLERGKFTQLFTTTTQATGPELALRMVVQALVLSPNFLFRTELGDVHDPGTTTKLTSYELASALSYAIWDRPPDGELLAHAASGQLSQPDTLASEARRLVSVTAKVAPSMHVFVGQWLQIDNFDRVQKDPALFPTYTPAVAQALSEETNRFVDSIVFEPGGDKTLRTLLTASYGYVNESTAPIYGVQFAGTALGRVTFNPAQRRGLLTLAAFLAAHSSSNSTGLVGRGRFFRQTMMCDAVPPPPGNFKFDPAVITPDMTEREKFEVHRKNPACASCHGLFDPIGIALENYDPIGRYRTMDKGKPIDPSGAIPLPNGTTSVTFPNYVDLINQLSALPEIYDCFSSQYLEYATGRRPEQVDTCDAQAVAKAFAASGYKLDELLVAIVTSPGFAVRKN